MQIVWSQGYIDLKKKKVRKDLLKYTKKQNFKTVLEEHDDKIVFLIRDSSIRPLDQIIYFDEKGKCKQEVRKFDCDSCGQKYLAKVLGIKSYKWKKVGSNQYYSTFALKRLLTEKTGIDGSHTFTVDRLNLNRKEYKEAIGAK